MTTFGDIVTRTRVRLMGQQREPINVLSSAIDTDDVSLPLAHSTRFIEGARLSVGLETVLAVAVGSGGSSNTVIRGIDGSTPAAHAQGDLVYVNPTWTSFEISQAINDELEDLSSPTNGLFRIRTAPDIIFNPSQAGYDLAGLDDFLDIWRIRYDAPGPVNDWKPIPRRFYRIDRAADISEFASKVQLVLMQGGYPGHKVRVSYKATFDRLVNESDDVEVTAGLHPQAHDILSLGAAMRLMAASEAQRSYATSQADPRRGDEAPVNSHMRAMQALAQLREQRINAEAARLARMYPESIA